MATNKQIIIDVTMQENSEVANIIARAELAPVWDEKNAQIKLEELEKNGITQDSLARYYTQLQTLVGLWCQAKRDISFDGLKKARFRFSEVKNVYLPTLMATILSQVGDVTIGNYRVEVAAAADAEVDRDFIIRMSEGLRDCRHILFAEKDQIGVANREVVADFMASVVLTMNATERSATVVSKDGTNPDPRLKLLSILAGIRLVNDAYSILYPVTDYISYAQPGDAIKITNP